MFVSIVFCTLLGFLAASQMVPRYTAAARVLISPGPLNTANMEHVLVSPDVASRDNIETQVEIIRSTRLLERVIETLQLGRKPEFNPNLKLQPPGLLEQAWNYVTNLLPDRSFLADLGIVPATVQLSGTDLDGAAQHQRARIVQEVRSALSLRPLANSRVVEIEFTSTNPQLAAQIANAVAEQFIVEQSDAKLQATRSATAWLTEQAEELQRRVREAENSVEMMRAELTQAAGPGARVTEQQLQVFVSALASARARSSGLDVRLGVVSQAIESGRDLGAVPEFRASPIMEDYRKRINSLRDEEVALRALHSEGSVELRVLGARVEDLRVNAQLEAQRIAEGLAAELRATREEERALLQQISALEQQALEQAREELRLRELEREAEASRRLYENTFSRRNEIAVQETLQTAGARLLSPAEPATIPETATFRRMVGLAGIAGVVLGVGLVFLLEQLNNTYRGIEQIERQTGYPVLAALPRIGRRTRLRQVAEHLRNNPNSAFGEAVRNLRTSILLSEIDHPPTVVMVTSSLPGEGKSVTSWMLALATQQAGKTTVIVDCDLRRSALGDFLQPKADEHDLLSLLDGTSVVEDAIVEEPATGLHLLTTHPDRRVEISAADILTSKRFAQVINALRERYDLVILDTPPVLLATDARVVATVADAILYAVRCDHTPRSAVTGGLRELNGVRAPMKGIVFTLVNWSAGMEYGFQGYGSYPHGYDNCHAS